MAERQLPDLVGRIKLDKSDLKKGVDGAKSDLQGLGSAADAIGRTTERSFDAAGKALTSLTPNSGAAAKSLEGVGSAAAGAGKQTETAFVNAGSGLEQIQGAGADAQLSLDGIGDSAQDAGATTADAAGSAAQALEGVGSSAESAGSTTVTAAEAAAAALKDGIVPAGEEAQRSLEQVGNAADSAASAAETAFGQASNALTRQLGPASGAASAALGKIGEKALAAGSVLQKAFITSTAAVAAGFAALAIKGVQSFVELTSSVRALQRVTGTTAEDASKLAGVLRTLGIEASVGEKAFVNLSKVAGNTPAKLHDLGIEVAKNSKGNIDLFGTLGNVAEAYQKVGAGAEGNVIATTALGKAGKDLIPLLGKTKDELQGINDILASRGLIFSQEDLQKGAEFSKATRDMKQAVQALEIELGRNLVPILARVIRDTSAVADAFNKVAHDAPEAVGRVADSIHDGLGDKASSVLKGLAKRLVDIRFGEGASDSIERLGTVAEKAAGGGGKLAASQEEVAAAVEETQRQADDAAAALDRLLNAQVSLVDSTLGVQGATDSFQRSLIDMKDKTAAVTVAIREHGAKSIEAAAAQRDLTESNHSAQEAASRLAHAIADQKEQQALANGETFDAGQKTQAYKDALLETARQIGGPVGAALTGLASQIQGIPPVELAFTNYAEFLQQIAIAVKAMDALAARSGISVNAILPGSHQVPLRMAGGPVSAGQPYIVGERQAELFVPNVSGTIVPSVPRGWEMNGPNVPAPSGDVFNFHFPNYLGSQEQLTRWIDGAMEDRRVGRHG